MKNPQKERKILIYIKNIYENPEVIVRANRVRMVAYALVGVGLIALGMHLSKSGVVQGFCDILICLSGLCLAFAAFHREANAANPILTEYTHLDRERLERRISTLGHRGPIPAENKSEQASDGDA